MELADFDQIYKKTTVPPGCLSMSPLQNLRVTTFWKYIKSPKIPLLGTPKYLKVSLGNPVGNLLKKIKHFASIP